MDDERPEIPPEDYKQPLSKGGDLPPLELLPTREWLGAKIVDVVYRIMMFQGKIQYMTKKETDDQGKEVEIQILNKENKPIPRREFYMTFEFHNYSLPNGDPRKAWLQLGASLGEQAHLPTFLYNVLGANYVAETPEEIVDSLKGKEIKLQLKNKPNKDPDKPPSQRVVYDAVERLDAESTPPPAEPIKEGEITPPESTGSNEGHCECPEADKKPDGDNNCQKCGKMIIAWDE